MNKSITHLFFALLLLLFCGCHDVTSTEGIRLVGSVKGFETDTVLLARVDAEVYNAVTPIDTILVSPDGTFSMENDSLPADLYALAPLTNKALNNYIVYTFLAPQGETRVTITATPEDFLLIHSEGTNLAEKYQAYLDGRRKAGHREVLDSLDNLFYRARRVGDDAEMRRIKRVSDPFYGQSHTDMDIYIASQLAQMPSDLFGVYLYYTHKFSRYKLGTMEEIASVREELNNFDQETHESPLYKRMVETLDRASQSCVGAIAPEIVGTTPSGEELRLSDLKGKYVLVDFWSSTCTWCRAETPNLLQTYQAYKGDNFTILGVSSDFRKESWLKAIEEDKTDWTHILMDREHVKEINKAYNITGIPLILLIDPEGKIIERNLRGEAIYNSVGDALAK